MSDFAHTMNVEICHSRTWFFIVSASSNKTPMFLDALEIGTVLLPRSMCGISMLFLTRGEHINIASVLSAFSLSLFTIIQFCIATTQCLQTVVAHEGVAHEGGRT